MNRYLRKRIRRSVAKAVSRSVVIAATDKRFWLALVCVWGIYSSPLAESRPVKTSAKKTKSRTQNAPEAVPGQLVVKIDENKSDEKAASIFAQVAAEISAQLPNKSKVSVAPLLTTPRFAVFNMSAADVPTALQLLNVHPAVAYAEPNFIYHAFDQANENAKEITVSDTEFKNLWAMKNTGQTDPESNQVGREGSDVHITRVWEEGYTGSKDVKVAIIDTGVNYHHEDLAENIWTAPDGTHGWNFVSNTNDPMDDNNHGTHCAGVIGAVGNNGKGVAGINWHVSLIPVKFLNADGGGVLSTAVDAIHFAIKSGANIMSNSWGGGSYSQALYDSIDDARKSNILFVAAAGNNSSDNDTVDSFPASYPLDNIISVAATDNRDRLAVFSNFGKTKVDVAAPGVKILSTFKDGGYGLMSGTSMATPHVSGIAALMLSLNPSLTYAQIKNILIKTSDKIRPLQHRVAAQGRVNAYNAIHDIESAPLPEPQGNWVEVPMAAESKHPYDNSVVASFPIHVPGAKFIKIKFDQVDTEAPFDPITVENADGDLLDVISGQKTDYVTDFIEGDSAVVRLIADETNNAFGFKVSKVMAVY